MQKTITGGSSTIYVYDAFGLLVNEYSTSRQASPCATCYLSWDHLGSLRMVMDQNGNVVARHDYLPFGEEIASGTAGRNSQWGPATDTISQKFTAQTRDSETGLDYFHARYYSGALGRLTSPDPANAGADLMNPQSWNGYAYIRNNPLRYTDPLGLYLIAPGDGGDQPCYVYDGWCSGPGPVPPCWDCGGGGGGGGHRGQPAPAPPLTSSPLPPGSWPGGENLGLPPGMSVPGPFGIGAPSLVFSFCRVNYWNCGALGQLNWWQKLQLRFAIAGFRVLYPLLINSGGIRIATISFAGNLRGLIGQSAWADLNPEQRMEAWEEYLNRRAANSGWSVGVNAEEEFGGVNREGIRVMRNTGEVFRTEDAGETRTSIIGPFQP